MTEVLQLDVLYPISWLKVHEGLRTPYNQDVARRDGVSQDSIFTEEQWIEFVWDDPNASPKPTWAELLLANRKVMVPRMAREADELLFYTTDHRQQLAEDAGADIHTGPITRLTGLLQMAEHANMAGQDIPHIVMRDSNGISTALHTQAAIRDVLSAAAARKNLIESGHNILVAKYSTFAALRDDDNQTLEVREASAQVALDLARNYETHLQTAMDSYDPDAMPDDLPTMKEVYAERLEAAALGRDKELRGHLTNQGVMLHPSCIDQAEAMQAVSVAYFNGTAAIRKAADADKAGKAFDKAKAAIEAVEVLNTPVITVNGLPPTGEEYPLAQVLVSADHPNANVAGEVEIIEVRVRGGALKKDSTKYHSATDTVTDHSVELVVDPQMFASVVIRARNICGVTRAVVELRNPIQKEE